MYDAVLACCRWLENTPWGVTVRDSSWMYPVVLWVHFIGLSMWLGTSLAVDLRLMGAAFSFVECRQRFQPVVERHKVLARLVGDDERFVESHPRRGAAALLSARRARVIHKDAGSALDLLFVRRDMIVKAFEKVAAQKGAHLVFVP